MPLKIVISLILLGPGRRAETSLTGNGHYVRLKASIVKPRRFAMKTLNSDFAAFLSVK